MNIAQILTDIQKEIAELHKHCIDEKLYRMAELTYSVLEATNHAATEWGMNKWKINK